MRAFERAARARKVALLIATIDLLTSEGLGSEHSLAHAEAVRKTFTSPEADRWWSTVERVADVHPASDETRRQVLAVYEQRARRAELMGVLPGGVS